MVKFCAKFFGDCLYGDVKFQIKSRFHKSRKRAPSGLMGLELQNSMNLEVTPRGIFQKQAPIGLMGLELQNSSDLRWRYEGMIGVSGVKGLKIAKTAYCKDRDVPDAWP